MILYVNGIEIILKEKKVEKERKREGNVKDKQKKNKTNRPFVWSIFLPIILRISIYI